MATATLPPLVAPEAAPERTPETGSSLSSFLSLGPATPWNFKTLAGLTALVIIWAAWFYGTWGAWGNLTADCGREMYVPSVLLEGKTLYRDIWYPYGPLAPYWNSLLYRWFGVHIEVLYWAGALSALGCALLLYHSGMRLGAALAGWTAGAALLFQAFHPTLFSFPLPYGYASVYGYLVSCVFLWLLIHGASSKSASWVLGAGMAAAVALLLKLEFGTACYATLLLLIVARTYRDRSWKSVVRDIAACLPGVMVCTVIILWMVSLRGANFLIQENLMSLPGTYFMKTYGKFWLASTGFTITGPVVKEAAERTFIFVALVQGLHLLISRGWPARRTAILRGILFAVALVYLFAYLNWYQKLCAVFFPKEMVLYVTVAALGAWWYFWQRREDGNGLALALLLTFSSLLAFRIMVKMAPVDFPVFYDGPAILCFLLLLRSLVQRIGRSRTFVLVTEMVVCLACLTVPAAHAFETVREVPRNSWLTTERGSIRVPQQTKENYQAAIQFMKAKNALGQPILSIPEDTSLYFFSGTHCPTRVYAFTPGVLAPGKMTDDLIRQIEQNHVRYLIWSNRVFPEYNVLRFGIDFDQTFGNYLTSHYRRVGPLTNRPPNYWDWNGYVWERIPDGEAR